MATGHRLEVGKGRWTGSWGCSCGTFHAHVDERSTAKAAHAEHLAKIKAREELAAALARWEGSPAQLFLDVENVADWAERDQDEIRQLADDEDQAREATTNGKIVRELARALRALLILDGWGPVKLTRAS